jgi:hypothetical protein
VEKRIYNRGGAVQRCASCLNFNIIELPLLFIIKCELERLRTGCCELWRVDESSRYLIGLVHILICSDIGITHHPLPLTTIGKLNLPHEPYKFWEKVYSNIFSNNLIGFYAYL